MPEGKEWVKVSHSANGVTVVTVTLVEGNLSARWSVKSFTSGIKAGVEEARTRAHQALTDLREATA